MYSFRFPNHYVNLVPLFDIDVKTFLFYFGHVFNVFNVFLFSKRFFYLKNVGKVQSGKQINKKQFQNNSNEIQWVRK